MRTEKNREFCFSDFKKQNKEIVQEVTGDGNCSL